MNPTPKEEPNHWEAIDKASRTETVRQCFCIGPQNGQPLCPCRMRDVKVVNGRYVEVIDHGPAPEDVA